MVAPESGFKIPDPVMLTSLNTDPVAGWNCPRATARFTVTLKAEASTSLVSSGVAAELATTRTKNCFAAPVPPEVNVWGPVPLNCTTPVFEVKVPLVLSQPPLTIMLAPASGFNIPLVLIVTVENMEPVAG